MHFFRLLSRIFPFAVLSSIVFVFSGCTSDDQESTPPNFVIIFTDDMGYGDLGCYGHPNIETPHLDRMADEGIRFTSFYAGASVCSPSRAALMTGRFPIRHMPHNTGPDSRDGLPLTEVTLAEALKFEGYRTMAIGKWHLGHLPEYLPTSRGFDGFYGLPYSNDMILPWCPWLSEEDKLFLYVDTTRVREVGFDQDELTVEYTTQAVEFIKRSKGSPFFLYLAHSMPHLPVSTTENFRGRSEAGLYGDVIRTIDWSVGEIRRTLSELGIEENTLIVFTSDNGPWHNLPDRMLQRGVERWHTGSTGMLRGAKGTTYEGGFRVPSIMFWPAEIPAGQLCHEMASTLDLFPTLVGIAGGELPGERVVDGRDIYSLITDQGPAEEMVFFFTRGTSLEAIRKGKLKLRVTRSDSIQLFNLEVDPGEKYNIADRHPDIVDDLLGEMKSFAEETEAGIALTGSTDQ